MLITNMLSNSKKTKIKIDVNQYYYYFLKVWLNIHTL